MLTELQKNKLTHYFNVLDYDKSGTLEKKDFISIGENLSVLWGFPPDSPEHQASIKRCSQIWKDFHQFIGKEDDEQASLSDWLDFADKHIVNGSDELYERHIHKVAMEIIDLFDTNADGFLSLNEYLDLFMAYRIEIKYSAKAFTKLDTNKDDLISREELLQAIKDFFRSDDESVPGNWLFGFWQNAQWV